MSFGAIENLILHSNPVNYSPGSNLTINAAGESCALIGRVRIEGGASSKVISAAGSGKILWFPAGATFNNGGTNFRVGIQDVNLSTGVEDGTFDVHADLVGGVDPITGAYKTTTMETGTKTISNGDLIAIVFEMTSFGGSDFVSMSRLAPFPTPGSNGQSFPYGTADTGSGPAKTGTQLPVAAILFDDGTLGYIHGCFTRTNTVASFTLSTATTPDEIVGTFVPSFTMQICGIGMLVSGIVTAEDFELILYEDPYGGSPIVLEASAQDPDLVGGAASGMHLARIPVTTLEAGTTYGIAVRPTTANSIVAYYADFTGAPEFKRALPFQSLKLASRVDNSGAFSEVDTDYAPIIMLDVCGLSDVSSGGGGEHSSVFG